MSIEVKVPALPESVADATIAQWHKKVGEEVKRDENILDLETDKVVLEVPSPVDGVIKEILAQNGDNVTAGDLLARIEEGASSSDTDSKKSESESKEEEKSAKEQEQKDEKSEKEQESGDKKQEKEEKEEEQSSEDEVMSPAVRRMLTENDLKPAQIKGSGKDGRITKEDVVQFIEDSRVKSQDKTPSEKDLKSQKDTSFAGSRASREERRVPMTRLRAKIAERLVEAQHNAAMLTTFNEVNLDEVMSLRSRYKAQFEKEYGVKLGLMSFFVKAVVESLKRFPAVNASIDGQDVVYHGYYDIGIAVSTERGLVVPVIRDADQMSMAEIEKAIIDFATRARDGKLKLEEMQGGTFTITNGGIFGSLLATPIINPPQTGILGMHKIEQRPIALDGQVVIRPMMYLALSYDHRLIDGKESVQFLVSVKELLEDPARLLLSV